MKLIKVKNYEEMSRTAADLFLAQVKEKPASVLGLATGSSPVGLYKNLAASGADFSQVITVNLDEYCGLAPGNPQSYRYFMNENLFSNININQANTHIPDGTAANPDAEAERYEELIRSLGGIDLQLLGMGHNGHIGFNEPDEEFAADTHRVYLAEQTIKANSRFFESPEEVPTSAVTMGIKTIMQAKKIIVIASGSEKTNILKKALYGAITPRVPASVLQLHWDLTVVTDCLG
ncbi:MAG: glucosamine-6-phosphate deaminase [Oscillospiraceae bacterium]|jgi:glucosamine-6-phosphate deaminase|nr:glucosamine-6-phosphate deaminase [Oscillospiraceae bacterium]